MRLTARAALWLLFPLCLAIGYGTMTYLDVGIGDEDVHRFQISWFIEGRCEIFQYVTMLPVYHLLMATLAKLTGLTSLDGLRFLHMLLAASVIPAFYLLCRRLYPDQAAVRALQLLLLPLAFPLFFVTYTDLPALALTLLMTSLTTKGDRKEKKM